MRREWEPEELIAAWTLLDGDWELVGNKTGATCLGFGLLLKFFEQEGRFPRHAGEVPKAAVDYVAGQVKVDPALFAEYRWSGSTIEYHRKQVREALKFRESTRADEDVLAEWLADKICPMVFTDEGLRAAVLRRCRTLKIEPPGRVDRIVGAGRARFEREFCLHVLNGLSADAARSLWGAGHGRGRVPAGAEVGPRAAGVGDAAGGDRQAPEGEGAGPVGGSVRRVLGPAGGFLAGAGDGLASVGFGGEPAAGPPGVGGRAGVVADDGDH